MNKPVLLGVEEATKINSGHIRLEKFPTDVFDPVIEALSEDPEVPNGIHEAARLLLTQCATVLRIVDMTKPEAGYSDDQTPFYIGRTILAFNDHGGGSESDFKILVNRHKEDGGVDQQLLIAPPDEAGIAANLTFHNGDFTFPSWEPRGPKGSSLTYYTYGNLPNNLKTGGASMAAGRRGNYDYFLFGDPSTPIAFSSLLEQIGFGYVDTPYDDDERWRLKTLGDVYKAGLDNFTDTRILWPKEGQFAAQLATLEAIASSEQD